MVKVVVCTSDKYNWCLKPFAYLFNEFWHPDQPVDIVGYTPPDFFLPKNFNFISIATPQYPPDKWADGLCQYLINIPDKNFVLMLEDYWLIRKVDFEGINILQRYLDLHPNVLRIDLTADRLYAGGVQDFCTWDRFDLIHAPGSEYQMSLQAGFWNRLAFLDVLERMNEEHHSAWNVEIYGTSLVNDSPYSVLGTRQNLIRYTNAMNNAISNTINFSGIPEDKLQTVKNLTSH